jgi:hypothetical protein
MDGTIFPDFHRELIFIIKIRGIIQIGMNAIKDLLRAFTDDECPGLFKALIDLQILLFQHNTHNGRILLHGFHIFCTGHIGQYPSMFTGSVAQIQAVHLRILSYIGQSHTVADF